MQGGPFNIHKRDQEVYLTVGIYGIRVLGGWGVRIHDFSIMLKKKGADIIVEPKKTILRIQSFEFNKRAKKIMVLDVPKSGKYHIEFKNPKSLEVRRSNLFITRLLFGDDKLPNESLEICIC
ncbi:MAG: hypothetical protein AAF611_09475 [Bacteroidota bacterium]